MLLPSPGPSEKKEPQWELCGNCSIYFNNNPPPKNTSALVGRAQVLIKWRLTECHQAASVSWSWCWVLAQSQLTETLESSRAIIHVNHNTCASPAEQPKLLQFFRIQSYKPTFLRLSGNVRTNYSFKLLFPFRKKKKNYFSLGIGGWPHLAPG